MSKAQPLSDGFTAECAALDAHAWTEVLLRFDDATVYQSRQYGDLRWGAENLRHVLLKNNGAVAAAAQVRLLRNMGLQIAYVTWGPVWKRRGAPADPEVLRQMMRALRNAFATGRSYLRVLPHLFQDAESAVALCISEGYERGDDESAYQTVMLSLTEDETTLRKGCRGNWRRSLQQAEKNADLEIRESRSVEAFASFHDLYEEMRRFKSFHDFASIEDFAALQSQWPEALTPGVTLCLHEGRVVSGAVWTSIGERGILLFLASSLAGRDLQAAYLVVWRMLLSMKSAGCAYYDAGGIHEGRNPGGAFFKKGTGGEVCRHPGAMDACGNAVTKFLVRGADRLRAWRRARIAQAAADADNTSDTVDDADAK